MLLDCLNLIRGPSLRLDQLVGSSQLVCGLGLGWKKIAVSEEHGEDGLLERKGHGERPGLCSLP